MTNVMLEDASSVLPASVLSRLHDCRLPGSSAAVLLRLRRCVCRRGVEADDLRPPSRTQSSVGPRLSPRQGLLGRGPSASDGPRRTSSVNLPRMPAAAAVVPPTDEVPGSTPQRKSMLSAQLQGAAQRGRGAAAGGRGARALPQSVSAPVLPMRATVAPSSVESNEIACDERSVGTSELGVFALDAGRSAEREGLPGPVRGSGAPR